MNLSKKNINALEYRCSAAMNEYTSRKAAATIAPTNEMTREWENIVDVQFWVEIMANIWLFPPCISLSRLAHSLRVCISLLIWSLQHIVCDLLFGKVFF